MNHTRLVGVLKGSTKTVTERHDAYRTCDTPAWYYGCDNVECPEDREWRERDFIEREFAFGRGADATN